MIIHFILQGAKRLEKIEEDPVIDEKMEAKATDESNAMDVGQDIVNEVNLDNL